MGVGKEKLLEKIFKKKDLGKKEKRWKKGKKRDKI